MINNDKFSVSKLLPRFNEIVILKMPKKITLKLQKTQNSAIKIDHNQLIY